MLNSNRTEKFSYLGVLATITVGLYASSLYSYLLFHSLIEIISIAVAFTLFIVTWNTRGYQANGYLRLLGTGYAFIGLIDLIHTLAYKGMNVFPGFDANLPTQLWIAARYLQAATLLIAPLLIQRKLDDRAIFAGYTVTVGTILTAIYTGNFPDCFIEGQGLTPFKIASEYLITAILLVALHLLYRERALFNDRVFRLLAVSIFFTAISEISFTAYASVYGFANLVGHFAKLAAFYLIYRAIFVTGIKEPFDLIFRDLKQAEMGLWKAHNSLEDTVRERTAELRESEERYRSLIQKVRTAIVLHDGEGRILTCNPMAEALLGLAEAQLRGKSPADPEWHFLREDGSIAPVAEYPVSRVLSTQLPLRDHVMGVRHASRGNIVWVLVNAEPEYDEAGNIWQIIVSFVDISQRKYAQEALLRLNRELRAISNCNQTLMHAEDEQRLLHDICHIVCNEAGYRMAWVGYAEPDAARTLRPVAWAGVDTGYLDQARLTWADTEAGRGPSGIAVRTGEVAGIEDYTTDPKAAPWRDEAMQRGYRSCIALPLKDESAQTFGVLNIYSAEPNTFTSEEKRLLAELAGDLAFGIAVLRARIERNQAHELIEKRIFALTRPMESGAIAFDDLFNLKDIQRIQDEFALATGVASLITLPDGTPLTAPSNFTCLCSEIIRRSDRGQANCIKSDAAIGRCHPEGPIVQPCLSGGLWDAGASMTVGGHHIANWLIGQVRDETQTEESMLAYAREIGVDEAGFMTAFQKVPAMSRDRFEQVARVLFSLANQLSSAAYQNVQQARFITERKVAQQEIEHLAFYDLLTQLPNRRLLQDRLQQAMADSGRSQHQGALLFIDLDNFKILNDTCGHDVGDQLLIEVARILCTCVREGDTVSRLGGDEFVIMLKDLGENPQEAATQAKSVGEKILASLDMPFTLAGRVHHSTPSIGVTLFLDSESSMDELLKQADIAMYQAKSAGRNTLRFYDPEMQAALTDRANLETSLRRAIQEQQFVLHFQPQVDDVRRIIGAEALLRWQHPERGMVSPAQFIPLAEETGLILPIGQWVLEEACARLKAWADDPRSRELCLAVNVSVRQFHQPDFVDQVRQVLENSGAPAKRLKLELTESMVLDNVKDTIEKMQALKQLGVGFSMDDFGTGYSSLSYLTRLPLDQLKIDQSFVRNLPDNANDAVVAQTIITLASSLGLAVIAEGVENEAQRQFLNQHGCPTFQGYLFSKPVALAAFEELLAKIDY